MEAFGHQDEGVKRKSGIKALILEIGVIALLIVGLVMVLMYFNVINLSNWNIFENSKLTQTTNLKSNDLPVSNNKQQNNVSVVDYLNSNADKAVLNLQFKGKITQIVKEPIVLYGRNYTLTYEILRSNGKVLSLYFNDETLSKFAVYQEKDGQKTPISLNEIKVGDEISIDEIVDFTVSTEILPAPGSSITKY